jgi:1,4-alpha-glucan branching enzyme
MSAPVGRAARGTVRGTAGEYVRGAARDIARDAASASGSAASAGPAGSAGSADSGEDERDMVACIANFSALPHLKYQIGLPRAGRWRELLNTDAAVYGGSGVGNLGGIEAVPEPYHGRPASAIITVPPLGVLWLAPEE